MQTAVPVQEWAQALRGFTLIGMSAATIILAQPVADTVVLTEAHVGQHPSAAVLAEPLTSIPDGNDGLQVLLYRGPQGATQAQKARIASAENIPQDHSLSSRLASDLRHVSGLQVDELCEVIGVSRATYNNWQHGEGMRGTYRARVEDLISTFQTLRDIFGENVRAFVHESGPLGRPLALLKAGKSELVIGLALRPARGAAISSLVSEAARQQSRLPGWLRYGRRLGWQTPRLSADEFAAAAAQLNPSSVYDTSDSDVLADDGDSEYVARGVILE